jgi:hypothetical protein
MSEWQTDTGVAAFRKLAEAVADLLGLTAGPAWDEHWSSAHLMAANGTGWSLSNPGGYGAKGMTTIAPIWPGRGWPPGGVQIKAGITASRGPEVIAARIRQLAPAYRVALAELAESQARDEAEATRREQLAAQIAAMIPDDDPDPDPRHPRVRVSSTSDRSTMTEVYIGGAGTVKFYREAGEIEIDRFRAPTEVVLGMLAAYVEGCAAWKPDPLVVGPPADYTHELRDPEPPPAPLRPPRPASSAGGSLPGPLRAARVARPELITGALRLLAAASDEGAKREPDVQEKTGTEG